jgi:hypothetical protein
MVVVSLLTLTICGGGYTDRNAFGFVGLLLVMFWGVPLIGLMTLFHFVERRFGPYVRYLIAFIGLFPLLLVIYSRGQGDAIYMLAIILAGLAWSAAWLATSYLFVNRSHLADPLSEEPSPTARHDPRSRRYNSPDLF